MCRYGNQDVRRMLNIERPLTALEMALFREALLFHLEKEFPPPSASES